MENTLVNGQCFNWQRVADNTNKYSGIYRHYFIVLERLDPDSVSLVSSPAMDDEFLNDTFLK